MENKQACSMLTAKPEIQPNARNAGDCKTILLMDMLIKAANYYTSPVHFHLEFLVV